MSADSEEHFVVRVLHTFNATSSNQITIHKGDLLTVLQRDSSGWWIGQTAQGQCGVFPSTYVQREFNEPPPADAATTVARDRALRNLPLTVLAPLLRGASSRAALPINFQLGGRNGPYVDDLFAMDDAELTSELSEVNGTIDALSTKAVSTFDALINRSNDLEEEATRVTLQQQLQITKKRAEAVAHDLSAAVEDYEASLMNLREAGIAVPACLVVDHSKAQAVANRPPREKKKKTPKQKKPATTGGNGTKPAARRDTRRPPSEAWLAKAGGDVPAARYMESLEASWTAVNARIDVLEEQKKELAAAVSTREAEVVTLSTELEGITNGTADAGGSNGQSTLRKIERKIGKLTEEISTLTALLATTERDAEALRKEADAGSKQYDELVAQHDALRAKSEAAMAASAAAEAEIADAKAQQAELDRQLAAAAAEVARIKEEAVKARAAEAQLYRQLEKERRAVYNELQELRGNLRVYCRLRPRPPGAAAFVLPLDDITLSVVDPATDRKAEYEFDYVLPESATQAQVFQEVQPLVTSVLDGYNICVFAYGQTGSGKTHTMEGTATDRGLSFRTLTELFALAAERRADGYEATFELSVLEVYNDKIYDLLDGRKATAARWGGKEVGVVVQPLKKEVVHSADDVQTRLQYAYSNRSVAGTDCNQHSSRSHCLLTIHVTSVNAAARSKFAAKLHLIDLAGSERVKNSGVEGARLTEATHINMSLTHLKSVIQALASTKVDQHVPFRNSALTSLLQDSLGGNCKCLMFANVSVLEGNVPESICTLKYAAEARRVEVGKVTSRAKAM